MLHEQLDDVKDEARNSLGFISLELFFSIKFFLCSVQCGWIALMKNYLLIIN